MKIVSDIVYLRYNAFLLDSFGPVKYVLYFGDIDEETETYPIPEINNNLFSK